jgi:tetratricopeptide (TPR) repeat protein
MKLFSNALIWSIILTGSVSFAKVQTTNQNNLKSSALGDKKLMEELTGQKAVPSKTVVQQNNLRQAPLPVQHFMAGQKAAEEKNYILAIKHFNTVIKNYPLSAQVKPALLAKAKVYEEMGLKAQANRNIQLAQLKTPQKINLKTSAATSPNKGKVTR